MILSRVTETQEEKEKNTLVLMRVDPELKCVHVHM